MKKKYRTPKAVNLPEETHAILAQILISGARRMINVAKSYVDFSASAEVPKTLQIKQ